MRVEFDDDVDAVVFAGVCVYVDVAMGLAVDVVVDAVVYFDGVSMFDV